MVISGSNSIKIVELYFTVIAIGLTIVVVAAISNILHLAIAVFRASRSKVTVSITTIVVTLAAVVFSWGVIGSAATRGGWSSSTAGRTLSTAT